MNFDGYYMKGEERVRELASCPFDPSHKMPPESLLTHINRCKNPYKSNFRLCPYNPEHYFLPQDMPAHIHSCPNRYEYEPMSSQMRFGANNASFNQSRPVYVERVVIGEN